jgi:hypothetical protein
MDVAALTGRTAAPAFSRYPFVEAHAAVGSARDCGLTAVPPTLRAALVAIGL